MPSRSMDTFTVHGIRATVKISVVTLIVMKSRRKGMYYLHSASIIAAISGYDDIIILASFVIFPTKCDPVPGNRMQLSSCKRAKGQDNINITVKNITGAICGKFRPLGAIC
ncbi:hypothetical protein Tco_0267573 [Tanacetum coccineum]